MVRFVGMRKFLFVAVALMCAIAVADAGIKVPGSAGGTPFTAMPMSPEGPPSAESSVTQPAPFSDYITWFGGWARFSWNDGKYVHAGTGATIEVVMIYGIYCYVRKDGTGATVESGIIV